MKTREQNQILGWATPVCVSAVVCLLATVILLTGPQKVGAQDEMPRDLLIKLSREQSQVLCSSETFTQCMGFTEAACFELSEKAVQQCLMPLPDPIKLSELDNSAIESCPKDIYAEAGHSDDKAVECLRKAMEK